MKSFLVPIFCLAFLCLSTSLSAQQVLSASEILATAKATNPIQLHQRKIAFLQNTSHEIPWIQELEFRTEVNEFDWRQQEYIFRMTPNSPKERKAQRQFHKANIQLNTIQEQQLLAEALEERYELLVDHAFTSPILLAQQQLHLLFEDKITVIKSSLENKKFDIEQLIQAEEDLFKLEMDQLEWKNQQEAIEQKLQLWTGSQTTIRLDTTSMIKQQQIIQLLNSTTDSTLNQHFSLQEYSGKLQLIDREYDLELAQINDPITYIQTKYGGRNRDNFQEAFTIGAGFKFPFKGDDKLDLNELKMDRLDEENKLQLKKQTLQEDNQESKWKIQKIRQHIDLLKRQLENSQAGFALEQLKKSEGANPMTLLRIQEILLKKELDILKLEYQVFRIYIDWLETSGLMAQSPLRNYLSNQLEPF